MDVTMAEFISGFDSVRSDWPNSIYEVNNIMMKIMQQQIGIKVRFRFFSFSSTNSSEVEAGLSFVVSPASILIAPSFDRETPCTV